MSLLIVATVVVLFPPLNFFVVLFSKKYLMAFPAGHSGGNNNIWPSSFHLLSVISMDKGLVPAISYSFWFVIL